MGYKIYIFDSHPVQYKAPVYQELQRINQDGFEVIYATDASIRVGTVDKEFGCEVAWDTPLLSGYPFRVLGNERGVPLSSPRSLTGRGVFALLRAERPAAVVLTQSHYWFDHAAYLSCLLLRIPILIRQETQDEMFAGQRHWLKSKLRTLVYRLMYAPVQHAFAFGSLNYQHLLRHGVDASKISFARFSVPDPISHMSDAVRDVERNQLRDQWHVGKDEVVLAFFGKFIPKKNPELLFEALQHVPAELRSRIHLLFVGSGELQSRLDALSDMALSTHGVRTHFVGFINQSQLPAYYLAADVVALPSRRMGEAWGLVINEALNAGCGVIMSDAVGCSAEFADMERARVIPEGNAQSLSNAISQLAMLPRDFDWAKDKMRSYSSAAAAHALHEVFRLHQQA